MEPSGNGAKWYWGRGGLLSFLDIALGDKVVGVVTWLGTIGGAVGLWLTFKQAKAARSAAEAATQAVAAFEGRMSLSALAYSYAQLGLVKDLVHTGDIRSAQVVFNPVKRAILEVCGLHLEDKGMLEAIRVTRRNVQLVEFQLEGVMHFA